MIDIQSDLIFIAEDVTMAPPGQKMISGWRKDLIEVRIRFSILLMVMRLVPFTRWYHVLHQLEKVRRDYSGNHKIKKIAFIAGRYYWDLYTPGWPSRSFDKFIEAEISRATLLNRKTNRLTSTIVAITKKCSLQCEHCFEWDALNKKEQLTSDDINSIIDTIQRNGSAQIHLSGGEPMLRFESIIDAMRCSNQSSDFWLLTSGLKMTMMSAHQLKNAGLTGVIVSLDHYEAESHNTFRHSKSAFASAKQAILNCNAVGLVTALSVCITREFANSTNLHQFMELAKLWNVSFVQFLEPKAVGHYSGKDVLLTDEHVRLLEKFFLDVNFDDRYRDYPIVSYHGYYQRRAGCMGAGNRSVYIDTDGDFHACPFCQKKMGNVLHDEFTSCVDDIRSKGCHSFKTAN